MAALRKKGSDKTINPDGLVRKNQNRRLVGGRGGGRVCGVCVVPTDLFL